MYFKENQRSQAGKDLLRRRWTLMRTGSEIDKYAIQTTQSNYPDTIQLGDAFQV